MLYDASRILYNASQEAYDEKEGSLVRDLDLIRDDISSLIVKINRSQASKPTSEPMSKEEPIKYDGKLWCALCGNFGNHQSGTCPEVPPNPLPSSPTDKCREEELRVESSHDPRSSNSLVENGQAKDKCREKYDEMIKIGHPLTGYGFWEAGWQSSRKECEDEIKDLKLSLWANKPMADALNEEIDRLKQELETAETNAKVWMDGYKALQSVVEAKDEALKRVVDCYDFHKDCLRNEDLQLVRAALQIDKSGGKKEEEKEFKDETDYSKFKNIYTPSATPLSSHVGTKEPTAKDQIQWLLENGCYISPSNSGVYCVVANILTHEIISFGRNPMEAICKAISKSREDATCAEAPLNSKKSVSASSTAISTEEGKK